MYVRLSYVYFIAPLPSVTAHRKFGIRITLTARFAYISKWQKKKKKNDWFLSFVICIAAIIRINTKKEKIYMLCYKNTFVFLSYTSCRYCIFMMVQILSISLILIQHITCTITQTFLYHSPHFLSLVLSYSQFARSMQKKKN